MNASSIVPTKTAKSDYRKFVDSLLNKIAIGYGVPVSELTKDFVQEFSLGAVTLRINRWQIEPCEQNSIIGLA